MVSRRFAELAERPLVVAGVLAGLVAFALVPVVLFSLLGVAEATPSGPPSPWSALLALFGAVAVVLGFALATWLYAEGHLELPGDR